MKRQKSRFRQRPCLHGTMLSSSLGRESFSLLELNRLLIDYSISSYQLQQLLMVSGDFECNPGPDKVKGKRVKFARVALEQLLAASFNFPSKIKKWMSGISLSGDKRYVLNRYLCLLAKSFKT